MVLCCCCVIHCCSWTLNWWELDFACYWLSLPPAQPVVIGECVIALFSSSCRIECSLHFGSCNSNDSISQRVPLTFSLVDACWVTSHNKQLQWLFFILPLCQRVPRFGRDSVTFASFHFYDEDRCQNQVDRYSTVFFFFHAIRRSIARPEQREADCRAGDDIWHLVHLIKSSVNSQWVNELLCCSWQHCEQFLSVP